MGQLTDRILQLYREGKLKEVEIPALEDKNLQAFLVLLQGEIIENGEDCQ